MRQRFMFWLDHDKPEEKQIAEEILLLKTAGLFARTIRDGIRLIQDLRAGRVDVLHELFPWVLEQQEPVSPPAHAHQLTDNTKLTTQLERLEKLLLTQGAVPISNGEKATESPIPLRKESRQEQRIDPDSIEFEITRSTQSETNNSAWNFMISSAALQGNYDNLPPTVINYGIETGRIPADTITKKSVAAGPKAMNVPQFEPPAFDDLDIPLDAG